jgi:hypothetical protein
MRNELTQKDIDDMQKEIDYRKLVVRPKALEDVKETRGPGRSFGKLRISCRQEIQEPE